MFVNNPDTLKNILPISAATHHILKGMFAIEPRDRPSLRQIRKLILAVDTFCLTEEQLRTAHSAARAAAAAVRPAVVAPAAPPPVVVATPAPRAPLEECFERHHITEPRLDLVRSEAEYAQVAVRAVHVDADYHDQHWSQHSSYADLDQDVLNQIDYHHHHHHHAPTVYRRAQTPAPHAQHVHAAAGTPSLVGGGNPFALETTSSQSSSSGDASLPPTPEFNPADKAVNGGGVIPVPVPAWTVGQQKVQYQDPELLHMSPLAPHRQALNPQSFFTSIYRMREAWMLEYPHYPFRYVIHGPAMITPITRAR